MKKPDYDAAKDAEGLSKKEVDAEWAYRRWCDGESIELIAEDLGVREGTVRHWIKDVMGRDRYERGKCEAKLNRMMQKCGKHMRITAMTDDVVLNKLENGEVDNIKDLLAVQKLYGDRVALAMGEATERADVTFEIVNYESDNNLNDAN